MLVWLIVVGNQFLVVNVDNIAASNIWTDFSEANRQLDQA